ncbi:hypothetical protein BABINDRAFT_96735 [Babjeviella inositovora NRRL Y-12698]|uniref:Uncharacterized protein n=1 Tax=Babjeviella inositovora NRRL Y-12698 TaxID=984486 RepID=A0A1E3QIT9_9ASCO|nr:uncharacterized protein BABINDRAFT_96735 [Babjeviella inositovora NRRL Y-12698]ODQ77633.1 hypothetical protein BABINDRAFT_96735 [Babjeviella inositovora NRRL Y-12698]
MQQRAGGLVKNLRSKISRQVFLLGLTRAGLETVGKLTKGIRVQLSRGKKRSDALFKSCSTLRPELSYFNTGQILWHAFQKAFPGWRFV